MTTLSQPLHAARVAEVSSPVGSPSHLPRLLTEWMRLAQEWSEALAHDLPGLDEIGAAHRRIEHAIETRHPAEWAIVGDRLMQWESGLLHTPEMPSAVCARCNPEGLNIEALLAATAGAAR